MSSDISRSKVPSRFLARRTMLAGLMAIPVNGACQSFDPQTLGDILGTAGIGQTIGGVSQAEAASGIREALANGVLSAIGIVGKTDGYFGDNLIKIPLPSGLRDVQNIMSSFGMGGLLSELQLQLNRGAEQAAPYAKDLFVDVISGVTISDALSIVQGSSTAATEYLQERTTPKLITLFTPVMSNALQGTGALALLDQLSSSLGNIPFGPSLGGNARDELIAHGVSYGLDGLFHYIGQQEAAIRSNPAERTTEILRRVFG